MLILRLIVLFLIFSAHCSGWAQTIRSLPDPDQSKVLVEFFYTAGCEECREIEDEVLTPLQELMGTSLDLRKYDILDPANYLHLANLHAKAGVHTTARMSIYIDRRIHLGGLQPIKTKLIPVAEAASLAKMDATQTMRDDGQGKNVLPQRLDSMTVTAVALAGLIDGLNPCAFATLIFLITLLTVARKSGRDLLAVGIGFCSAVFLTYFLLGFGIFHVIQKLAVFHWAGEMLRWITVAALAGLCMLAFKDALIFSQTGQARTVSLQLPGAIRTHMHDRMRSLLTARRLLPGSFIVGMLVTLMESICTGQFYVPTLVYLSRQAAVGRQALGWLTLYNVMFVIPHVLVFAAAYCGITNNRLLAWSRANAVWSKALLGTGFAALAGLLAWM